MGVAEDGFELLVDLPARADVELVADVAAGEAAAVACVVRAREAVGGAGQPVPAVAEVHPQRVGGRELHPQLGRADVLEDDVVVGRPRAAEAVEALEASVLAVVRILVTAGVAVEGAEARLPGQLEAVAELGRPRPGAQIAGAAVPELADHRQIVVETGPPDAAVSAQARRVDHASDRIRRLGLVQPQIEGLQGHDLRPASPVSDQGVDPAAVDRFVPLVFLAFERLDGQQVEAPIIRVLTDRAAEAEEGVGGVAPLVVPDQAAVQELEILDAVTQAEGPLVAARVGGQQFVEIQFGLQPDHLELVPVPVVPRVVAVMAPRILHLEREAEGVEAVVHPEIGPRPVEEGQVGAGAVAADVVVAVFGAEAVVDAEVEPVEVLERFDPELGGVAGVFGDVRIPRGAVAERRLVVGGLRLGRIGESRQHAEKKDGCGGRDGMEFHGILRSLGVRWSGRLWQDGSGRRRPDRRDSVERES